MGVLNSNYQVISTNRFVIDSDRFWRAEFHPHFKDIFTMDQFNEVMNNVNKDLSFKFDDDKITEFSIYLYEWFSGYRFGLIPKKNPSAPKQFLADMYYTLYDVFAEMSIADYPLTVDDLNDYISTAVTGKVDTSTVSADERVKSDTLGRTELYQDDTSTASQQNTTNIDNVDEITDQNTTDVSDQYLSPQNIGALPANSNEKGKGVEGIGQAYVEGNTLFTTTKNIETVGDSTVNKSNTLSQGQQSDSGITASKGSRAENEKADSAESGNTVENQLQKNDSYTMNKDFSLVSKLGNLIDLSSSRFWNEILARLSKWILQFDIATSERNYVGCTYYPDGE